MNSATTANGKPIWKNPLVYTSTIVLLVALYVGWIVFSRWNENRSIEQRTRDAAAKKQQEHDRETVEQMGGSGVANAKKVTLEPQSNPVWPSYSRCVDVKPTKTTTYTLTASDDTGHSVSQTLTVKVQ